ncbi:MAG TPA: OsmC family protein [Candidatus Competibacteraceae bacterium]|nr:MAG: OsmC family peroxiredoxin [Candidatus Competibacteraceae bacterium]HQC73082.1 OsmC family protein [Candidatus Competibacteraceae bacterium]
MASLKKIQVTSTLGPKFTIESRIRDHLIYVDQPTPGGDDKGPTPLEYLFVSLAGCIGSIARIVASQRRLPLRGMEISVEGELDGEVLMGKSTANRAGFQGLTVNVVIDADMTQAEKEEFLHEVDRRCPISDNILNTTPISFKVC